MTSTQQMLDDRYGRRHGARSRRGTIVAAAIAIGAAVAATAWFGLAQSSSSINSDTISYKVLTPRTVSVTFQVSAPAGSDVYCVLEADDSEHGIVGWKVLKLPTSTSHTHAFDRTVPTVSEAVTGLVNSCWVA